MRIRLLTLVGGHVEALPFMLEHYRRVHGELLIRARFWGFRDLATIA
jgi:hypothetical protein